MPNESKPFTPIHDEQHHARKSVLFFLLAVASLLVVAAALVTWMQVSTEELEQNSSGPVIKFN